MKNELLIIAGKLMRNGIEEKPEFGNLEQIQALKEAEELLKELTTGLALDPEYEEITTYDAIFYFTCVCGKKRTELKKN